MLILVTRAPYGRIDLAEAIRHFNGAVAAGLDVSLVLTGDAVLAAKEGQEAGSTGWQPLGPALRQAMERAREKGAVLLEQGEAERWELSDELRPDFRLVELGEVARLVAESDHILIF